MASPARASPQALTGAVPPAVLLAARSGGGNLEAGAAGPTGPHLRAGSVPCRADDDVVLVVSDSVHSPPRVARVAARHEVLAGVVLRVAVDVVDHERALGGVLARRPLHRSPAPRAGVRARADGVVQHHPMLRHDARLPRKRVARPHVHHAVPGRYHVLATGSPVAPLGAEVPAVPDAAGDAGERGPAAVTCQFDPHSASVAQQESF